MSDALLHELLAARERREPCVLVTVAATTGSVPREAGAKMLVHGSGKISGTIGGGKFESLVIAESLAALRERKPVLKTFPLHEGDADSIAAPWNFCVHECSCYVTEACRTMLEP